MAGKITREQIVEAADRLFYQHGYAHTSFADIAGAVGVSRGNFYYYFRTKDEILDAVIARRLDATRAMLADWEAEGGDPAARIRCFVRILVMNRAKILLYGCPVGTLSTELAKLEHGARGDAAAIFTLFRDWLGCQFRALGHGPDADDLAIHILARSQGIATLANAFDDEPFLHRETEALCAWIDSRCDLRPTGEPALSLTT